MKNSQRVLSVLGGGATRAEQPPSKMYERAVEDVWSLVLVSRSRREEEEEVVVGASFDDVVVAVVVVVVVAVVLVVPAAGLSSFSVSSALASISMTSRCLGGRRRERMIRAIRLSMKRRTIVVFVRAKITSFIVV